VIFCGIEEKLEKGKVGRGRPPSPNINTDPPHPHYSHSHPMQKLSILQLILD
jgi:hypothetical protein